MEDILASIRKIIAEDPPGSRPLPTITQKAAPAVSANPLPERGFMSRDTFLRNSSGAAAPEPYLKSLPNGFTNSLERSDGASNNGPSLSMPSADGRSAGNAASASKTEPLSTEPRPEPKSKILSEPDASATAAGNMAERPAAAEIKKFEAEFQSGAIAPARSIDDQLSDLLADDVLPSIPSIEAPASEPALSAGANAAKVTDEGQAAPIWSPHVPRAGFTVSRAGFDAAGDQNGSKSDPFAFDLGPSPFASRGEADLSLLQDAALEAARSEAADIVASMTSASGSVSSLKSDPKPMLATPSVAATLGPITKLDPLPSAPSTISKTGTSDGEFVEAVAPPRPASAKENNAAVAPELTPVFEPIVEPAPQKTGSSASANRQQESDDAIPLPKSSSLTVSDSTQRSVEDTMADLLRPMLKLWLAENMPKIVERALRREMSEKGLSEHKTAAE